MLRKLHIQNYALIDRLDIEFQNDFSVITGETGAGKSIILGAIGLLLGQRADSKAIKGDAPRCTLEALFEVEGCGMDDFFERNDLDFDGRECIIRREVSATGKSRAFVNDTPVQLALLKELGEKLIDIHSQHQNLLLNQEDFQLGVIDILARDRKETEVYRQTYDKYRKADRRLKQAQEETERNRADEDFLTFQLQQLDEAGLRTGEQEELEQEAETLAHAEEIKSALFQTDELLTGDEGGVLHALKEGRRRLESLVKVFPAAEELAARAESCYIELKDIAAEVSTQAERVEFNPERLDYVNERLNTLYSLQQKHHAADTSELMALADRYRAQLDAIAHSDDRLQELSEQKARLHDRLLKEAATLTRLRKAAAAQAEKQMKERLVPLGIPNVQFKVELTAREEPDATGMDKISFLFSANKNGALQPISQVASGGEIARVMLSLKALISGAVQLPTIIFDEIDTGVSGHIAEKMALIMQEMGASNRQVISITHLPQIAALGSVHYKVYKEDDERGTASHIVRLDEAQRVEEIAHMLSGATLTEAAVNNAKALLKLKKHTSET